MFLKITLIIINNPTNLICLTIKRNFLKNVFTSQVQKKVYSSKTLLYWMLYFMSAFMISIEIYKIICNAMQTSSK